jgi:hypothetical protein
MNRRTYTVMYRQARLQARIMAAGLEQGTLASIRHDGIVFCAAGTRTGRRDGYVRRDDPEHGLPGVLASLLCRNSLLLVRRWLAVPAIRDIITLARARGPVPLPR